MQRLCACGTLAQVPTDGGDATCPTCGAGLPGPRAMPLLLPPAPGEAAIDPGPEPDLHRDLPRESKVRGLASVWAVAGLLLLLSSAVRFVGTGAYAPGVWVGATGSAVYFVLLLIPAVWGAATLAAAWGLRRFHPAARRAALVLCVLQLLYHGWIVLQMGPLLNRYGDELFVTLTLAYQGIHGLWLVIQMTLLMAADTRAIFNPEYADIVARTPGLRASPYTSAYFWAPLLVFGVMYGWPYLSLTIR